MDKIRCRLCEKEYEDKEMSDEHYPAHSVGNDDIVQLNSKPSIMSTTKHKTPHCCRA